MSRESKLLDFYIGNQKPVSDKEVAKATGLTRRSLPALRCQLVNEGHGFKLTTNQAGGYNVEYLFQITHDFNGIKCFDEIKSGVSSTKIRGILGDLQSESMIETCEAIAKLNSKGYWTNSDLAKAMNINQDTAIKRKNTFAFSHGLEIHGRGKSNEREFRVIGIDPSKKQAASKRVKIETPKGPFARAFQLMGV